MILIVSGFVSFIWSMIRCNDKKMGDKVLSKIFQFIGFFWGVTTLFWGVYTLGSDTYPGWAAWMLIIVGLSLFLKPVKEIPWASMVSLLAASSLTAMLAYHMPPVLFFGYDLRWLLSIVFLCILFTLYVVLKFLEKIFKVIGMILSSDPISLLIGFAGMALGIVSMFVV